VPLNPLVNENVGNILTDSPQRAKIAKYACEHGNASAVRHFAKILGKPINESTVRSMKKQYLRELDHSPDTILTELPKCKTGCPLLLGKYDEEVLNYVRKLSKSGAIVNRQFLIAGAKGNWWSHRLRLTVGRIFLETGRIYAP
jgi:hypothetical protein